MSTFKNGDVIKRDDGWYGICVNVDPLGGDDLRIMWLIRGGDSADDIVITSTSPHHAAGKSGKVLANMQDIFREVYDGA